MSLSINTNRSAMVALETLNQTQGDLEKAENSVATGKKVSSAADNPASYGISSQINNDVAGQEAVNDGLSYASEIVSTSLNAAGQIVSTLNDVRSAVESLVQNSTQKDSLDSVNAKLQGLAGTINTIARNATVKGVNLLAMSSSDGYGISSTNFSYLTGSTGDMQVLTSAKTTLGSAAANANVMTDALGLTTGSSAGSNGAAINNTLAVSMKDGIVDEKSVTAVIDKIKAAVSSMTSVTSTLGASKITIATMSTYGKNLSNSLQNASGSLVDADMSAESAKLTSLQTKQSLGIKALTIANGQSQNILSLFQ
ncbi:flagellin C (plasmid) [Aristophania vespae]|uniref:Flagellin n=1 Tax=Aristophania vespae TaxID=2697033 RepID=A0A6P1NH12_9PROT|nr:flagellin [Aristophania vespae]QHI96513.1 flagellin C [Aristophania vespae]UMM64801.1 Flagellin [Aristophania vespae]